jgi:hypothetical protein
MLFLCLISQHHNKVAQDASGAGPTHAMHQEKVPAVVRTLTPPDAINK